MRRRAALLDVARSLFVERGYKGTTLEAIISRSGGSRESIYQFFGGKRGLFQAIIGDVGEALAASIGEPAALQVPPREGLTRYGLQLLAIWSTDEADAIHRVVLSEGLDSPELMDAWYSGGTKLSLRAIGEYLAAQHAAGRLAVADPETAARQFLLLLMAEFAYPVMAGLKQPADPAACVARTVDLVLRAYAPQHCNGSD